MADETTQIPPATSEETEKTKGGDEVTKPEGDKKSDGDKPKLFTQDDMDRIIRDRLSDEQKRAQKKIDDGNKSANEQRLKEQGEFKVLAEQRESRIKELEGELASEKMRSVRAEVAAEFKLPKAVADRLQGTTRDELVADAKELAKVVGPPRAPETELGPKKPVDPTKAAKEEQERQAATGRYSIM